MAHVTKGCWHCESQHSPHRCSACGKPVKHDATFCKTCDPIMFGKEKS